MSPRILLSNQLLNEVRLDLETINNVDAQYLVVHSGGADKRSNEDIKTSRALGHPFRMTMGGTTKAVIKDAYDKAVAEKVNLIISSTYHSAERIIQAGIPVEILYCDEAHYLVREDFSWIVSTPFTAKRTYFFTATTRDTPSAEGMGMNNTSLFGDILYSEVPAALIDVGEMVRPRMHLVALDHSPTKDEADALAVSEAFRQHSGMVNIGAKLLVVAKDGSDHLDSLVTNDELQELKARTPSLRIFDISSKFGPRIDAVKVSKKVFLNTLQSLKTDDKAIIIHKDILAEGIDVPGISGIMPFGSLKKSKFLQTLGRATRLYGIDRDRLYSGNMLPTELKKFVKPYAWLIIPTYGEIGQDLKVELQNYVRDMREYGFSPSEYIVIVEARGEGVAKEIRKVTAPDKVISGLVEFSANVLHDIESQIEADEMRAISDEYASKSLAEMFELMS